MAIYGLSIWSRFFPAVAPSEAIFEASFGRPQADFLIDSLVAEKSWERFSLQDLPENLGFFSGESSDVTQKNHVFSPRIARLS